MKWVLGDIFKYKLNKPKVPAYVFKKYEYEDGLNKKVEYKKKISLYNLFVYLYLHVYVKKLYKFLCNYIFPISSFLNKIIVNVIRVLFKTKTLYVLYSMAYSTCIWMIKITVRHFTNINGLRFLFYVIMVDVSFRAPSCQIKDYIAKKFKLTANNEQPSIDYFLEVMINSYLNFEMTDTKVDFLASKKRRFLSFFLLYEEKERIVVSNKLFLENLFLFLSSFYKGTDKQKIEEYKFFFWKRLVYLVSIFRRADAKIVAKLILFVLKKLFSIFALILFIPTVSLIFQFIFLPILKSFLYFANLSYIFIKEIFLSTYELFSFIYNISINVLDVLKVLFYIYRTNETDYESICLHFSDKKKNEGRAVIQFLKLLFIPFYKIYYFLPSKAFLKSFFVEYVVKRSIEPTLQNGDDGFLFVHKQKSVFNNKTREFMDSELLDFILSTEDLKYWEFDMDDQIEKKEEERAELLFKEYLNPAILEQEEDDDEEEEYDFEEDFWLMEINSFEDDGFVDLFFLLESLKGFFFSFPLTNYFVILLSALSQGYYRVWFQHRMMIPFGYLDERQHDSIFYEVLFTYIGNKLLNVFWWLGVGFAWGINSFLIGHWVFEEERRFPIYINSVKMIDVWVPSMQTYLPHCLYACLLFWLCFYLTDWLHVEEQELLIDEQRDDIAYMEEEEYEISEDFGIFIFIYCSYLFLSSSAWNLIVHPMRYLEQTPMLYRNHNFLDLVCNVQGYLEFLFINLCRILEHIVSFFIG